MHEMQRTGDVLQVLAMVTRVLPDDTFSPISRCAADI